MSVTPVTCAPLLLVVGMHRSGTSLLSGILKRLGVAFPGEAIPADHHNPEGYFEWDQVVEIQERLLVDLSRWWPSSEGTLSLPIGWLEHPSTLNAYEQLKALIQPLLVNQNSLWCIKDPRTSRLLPLWIKLAKEFSIPLQVLLAVRDPSEVVTSLVTRDGPSTGMDSVRAQQIWWIHNLEVVDHASSAEIPLSVIDFGRWFVNSEQQIDYLINALPSFQPSDVERSNALSLIKVEHRRSKDSSDHSLFPRVKRLYRRLLRNPLPSSWPSSTPPFGPRKSCANPLLNSPDRWFDWLNLHSNYPAPRFFHAQPLSQSCHINVCGQTWHDLLPHLLLQWLPFADLGRCTVDFNQSNLHHLQLFVPPITSSAPLNLFAHSSDLPSVSFERIAINLELPNPDQTSHWLSHLRCQDLIFDPDPARVLLMRALDLPAWWIDCSNSPNGWLQLPQAIDPGEWASRLGLSPPEHGHLMVLGSAGDVFERSLAGEGFLSLHETGLPISYFPGWSELCIHDVASGFLRAGWLQSAAIQADRLVAGGVDFCPPCWAFLQSFKNCIANPEGAPTAELRVRHSELPATSLAEDRESPPVDTLFQWNDSCLELAQPVASVLISLYNYSDRIVEALQSVKAQTQHHLELIVVDDASTDESALVAHRWIDECLKSDNHPFVRVLLVRHTRNAGLATARNTAFGLSLAPWCFVLDADNALFPDAVSACLSLALRGDHQLAVVHPLLSVEAEPGRPDEHRTLVSSASWQRERLLGGNVVDAMALVRRSAWEAVKGYTHIQGGWEDYDFWCKIIESGFYGIQCPRILAVYRSHAESMTHCLTNNSWYALSRTLQFRHPWLSLPLAHQADVR